MKQTRIDLDRQLASVPLRNTHVKTEPCEPGQVPVLEVELQYKGPAAMFSRLLPVRRKRRLRLDPVGWSVYARIDGRKTFEQLTDDFAEEHQLDFLESRSLLMAHILNLMRAGLVVVGVKTIQQASGTTTKNK